MSIVGIDNRTIVGNANADPFDSVVAVDTRLSANGIPSVGSGIVIGRNHILTAGHVIFGGLGARITLGQNVPGLSSRTQTQISANDDNAAASGFSFPVNGYNGGGGGDDLALATLNQPITDPSRYIGLVAFVNPEDSGGLNVTTAGYPGLVETINIDLANLNASNSNNAQFLITDANGNPSAPINYASGAFLTGAQTIFTASGVIDSTQSDGQFSLSPEIDIEAGQSGSGYWTTLDGDSFPRVLGVASFQTTTTPGGFLGFGADAGDNFGALITTDVYDSIVMTMQATPNSLSGNDLPENAIIGSDSSSFLFFQTASGDDNIIGSYRRERIIGQGGNDTLLGGGADDRLEGGDGVDQALFSDEFINYDFTITDPSNPAFEFVHARGTQADGTDTTRDIEFGVFEFVDGDNDGNDDNGELFFVPLQVDPDDNTKLRDGTEITPEEDILDSDGNNIGTITVESPAWMFDGDVNYTLTIGSEQGILFNFAYIIDVSGSMRGTPLAEAQAAYQALTQSLIDDGVADNSEFAVIPFNNSASLIAPLDGSGAISSINGLSAGGGTSFGPALAQAQNFFNSPSRNNNATNIAYFLSDGFGSGASSSLQSVAEVRAFGIGGADLSTLNIIDSDNAVLLSNPADLVTEFNASTVDRNTIDRIEVKVDGNVVDTISPDQLVEDTLGLQFEGTIDGLEVSREAENDITFDVIFNNGTPTASLDYKITTGQEEVTQQTSNGTKEIISFSVNQADFVPTSVSQVVSREIIGNNLDNTIEVIEGENTILANDGNDRIILSGGINLVDGGDGVDTAVINLTQAEAGAISQNGQVTNIGTDNTLLNVEFIEFSDVRLSVDTLAVTPTISLAEAGIETTEGDSGSATATFTVNLSSVATEDVVVDFTTRSDNADAGTDFVETSGQLTIAAGETSGEIDVEILGDTDIEGDEQVFLDLTAVSGGTFADGATTEIAGVNILDDDSFVAIPLTGILQTVTEGNPDSPSSLTFTLERFGSLNEADTVEVEITAAGDNPAQASDLINGFSSTQVTFAPGENTKTVDIPISPDTETEGDETFGVRLTNVSGSALVPTEDIIFTIIDDESLGDNPVDDTPENESPIAVEDSFSTDENAAFVADVLTNDSDPDGDDISIIQVNGGDVAVDEVVTLDSGATLNLLADNTFNYDPNGQFDSLAAGETANDTFSYSIQDSNGNISSATVSVTINGVDDEVTDEFVLNGDDSPNNITGTDADETINGFGGNDTLNGSDGNDLIDGGDGDDNLNGENGDDTLIGGSGNDVINTNQGNHLIDGGEGNDILNANNGNDTINGGSGEDLINSGQGADIIDGGDDNDTLSGGGGDDSIIGGAGDDLLNGDNGNDTLIGGSGTDRITGGGGNDVFVLSIESSEDTFSDFNRQQDFIGLSDGLTFNQLEITGSNSTSIIFEGNTIAVISGLESSRLEADRFIEI